MGRRQSSADVIDDVAQDGTGQTSGSGEPVRRRCHDIAREQDRKASVQIDRNEVEHRQRRLCTLRGVLACVLAHPRRCGSELAVAVPFAG